MDQIAVIDIGSNSIKLVLAKYDEYGFQIIDELKESVRLGEGMDQNDFMKETRIAKGMETLEMFNDLCLATKTDKIVAVATAAVRNATNGKEFISRVKKQIGLDIQILSAEEEAFYDYCGVVNSIDIKDGLIVDIGGGSIEIVWMKDRKAHKVHSFDFGAVTLSSMFHLQDKIREDSLKKLRKHLMNAFEGIKWLDSENFDVLLGVGGTIRNIGRINQRKKKYSLAKMHYYQLQLKEVSTVFGLVSSKNLKKRLKIKGLSKKRADIFVGANGFIKYIMEYLSIDDLLISGKGIREGILYNEKILGGHIVENVLNYSLKSNMIKLPEFTSHMEHVHKLLNILVTNLKGLFSFEFKSFDGSIDKIIKTAASLHDIGSIIDYYDHHEHTFYMILNSDINGITHREQLLAAFIAASHRHTNYDLHKYNLNRKQFKDIISKDGKDKELIRKVGILLEIAESLDRNMTGAIMIQSCEVTDENVIIKITSRKNPNLEIIDALECSKGFEKKFKKNLIIKSL